MTDRAFPAPSPTRAPGAPGAADPTALFEALDLLPQHLALVTGAGGILRVNRWLAELLTGAPDRPLLESSMGALARSLADARRPGGADAPRVCEVRLAGRACRMWGWCVELGRYGFGGCVLVTVLPGDPDSPPDEVLRQRFRLTRKEIRVARLLDEGRSNAGIAAALCISPHTARHHTERIMAKLGAGSRAEVGPRLRCLCADHPGKWAGPPM